MKTSMTKYTCDKCSVAKIVPDQDQMQPDGWLFLAAWVVGGGGSTQPDHYCPECRDAVLKALGR